MEPYEMPKTVSNIVKRQIRQLSKKLTENGEMDAGVLSELNKMINNFSRLQEIIQQGEPELPVVNSDTGYRRGSMRGPY